ncbi:MAG: hypothetical protein IJO56_01635 [Oscillospiraceae bacterium]|nr:hypothetical protein [Oscillospiraceae bacterium]
MKNFDARMDEIIRRSEEMKRLQRRRKKIGLALLPVALCAVLCLTVILPGIPTDAYVSNGGAAGGMPGRGETPEGYTESYSGVGTSITQIRITGKGLDRTVSDPAVIDQICALWGKGTASTPNFSISGATVGGTGQNSTDGATVDIDGGKSSPKDFYIVSFTDIDGTVRKYKLNESVLTELSTGETDFLMGEEQEELYGLLGLPLE